MTVAELIKELQGLPPHEKIYCHVVGNKSGAWLMNYEICRKPDIPPDDCYTFNWIRVTHPDLDELPSWDTIRAIEAGSQTLVRKNFQLTRLLRSYYESEDHNNLEYAKALERGGLAPQPCLCRWCQEIRDNNLLS